LSEGTDEEKRLSALVSTWSASQLHDMALVLIDRRRDLKLGMDPIFVLLLAFTKASQIRSGVAVAQMSVQAPAPVPADNHLVFGVEQLAQLKEDVELIANPPVAIVEAVAEINKEFENMSHSIVLSSLWGKLK
jgi:hypothetical protein